MKKTKRTILNIMTVATMLLATVMTVSAQETSIQHQTGKGSWKSIKGEISLFVANDLGRNGYYFQKPIAELMGEIAEEIGPEAIVAAGDIHHFNGVASVDDPLWTTNFEKIYSHPELMIDWFPVLGNHEYRGNTQAVMDYREISRRWMSGERYFSKTFIKKGVSLRVIFLDTTPLITRYIKEPEKYPDACKQDAEAQMAWLDNTLSKAKEKWIIVVGHHPIYAQTPKSSDERKDMQARLLPILRKHDNVALYVCGHIHNFQHIRMPEDNTDYVVNSAGSLARKVEKTEGTVFCSPEPGFSVISVSKDCLALYMINKTGKVIHEVKKMTGSR